MILLQISVCFWLISTNTLATFINQINGDLWSETINNLEISQQSNLKLINKKIYKYLNDTNGKAINDIKWLQNVINNIHTQHSLCVLVSLPIAMLDNHCV